MTPNIARMIYLPFVAQLKIRAIKENLNSDLIQGQLDEAKHQLNIAIKKSQGGFRHGF